MLGLVLAGAPACKQGEGEPCQYDSDCQDGLTCVQSSRVCQSSAPLQDGGGGADAPNDAGIDASPLDVDASPLDASPLDAVTADAVPSDAAPDA